MLYVDSETFDGAIRALAVLHSRKPQRLHVTGWGGVSAALWICKVEVKMIVAAAAKARGVAELLDMVLPQNAHMDMSAEPVALITCWYVLWNRTKPTEIRAWASRAELIETLVNTTKVPGVGWGQCTAGRHKALRYSRATTYTPFGTGQRLPAEQGNIVGWFREGVQEAVSMTLIHH